MLQKIKIDGEWKNIINVYKKVNGHWTRQDYYDFDNNAYFFSSDSVSTDTFLIVANDSYLGQQFYVVATLNNVQVSPTWSITSGSQYATINQSGLITILTGAENSLITVEADYSTFTDSKQISITFENILKIEGLATMTGTSGNVIALYQSQVVNPTWSIASGNQYATISQSGEITILASGQITVQASYNNAVETKTITLVYEPGSSSQTEIDPDTGAITNTETTTTTDPETGVVTETTTSITTNEDGSSSETQTETIINTDGSSTTNSTTTNSDGTSSETTSSTSAPDPNTGAVTSQSETLNYDENGDLTGSQTNNTVQNTDGSSTSSTTNFDENGDPTDQQNQATDTTGNVSTQDIEYENGQPVVTGYDIDTSASEGDGKAFNQDGVNTEYYAFDLTHGFVLNFHFTIDFTAQPAGQNENHHNVLTMKRATPSPWYGFQIRQSNTNKYVQLGTQFATGSNTNTTINPTWIENNKVGEYDLTITYNPTAASNENKFICYNNLTQAQVYASKLGFPDNADLKYLKVTIGYAMDENGDPYRYSNINVLNFNITRT